MKPKLSRDETLDVERMKAWMQVFRTESKEDAKEAFRDMRTWWAMRAEPVQRTRLVNGKPTRDEGWDIPRHVRELVITEQRNAANGTPVTSRFTLLNLAVGRKSSTLTEWALRGGWAPNFYGGLVTPIGQAIYTGDVKGVALMRDFGADLVMALGEEHGSAQRPIRPRDLGSTALHRLMEKPDPGTKAQIVQILVEAYPDPLPRTHQGETPLDWAVDQVGVTEIRREVARRERAVMVDWANTALDRPHDPKPRSRL